MRSVALALVLMLATACGQVPQPFRHAGEAPQGEPPVTAFAVAVEAPDALSGPLGRYLAEKVAAGLRERSLPAHTGDAARDAGFVLSPAWQAGDGAAPRLEWTLTRVGGEVVGTWTQPAAALNAARDPAAVDRLARAAGGPLAGLLKPETRGRQKAATPAGAAAVAVTEVRGAPGEQGSVLAAALRRALDAAGWRTGGGDGAYRIAGTVDAERAADGARLSVTWTVTGPDGAEVGRTEQANTVPPAALTARWPGTANAIARSAVPGLKRLLPAPAEPPPGERAGDP